MSKFPAFFILVMVFSGAPQERFPSGKFKGFTRPPYEHIIVPVEEPFVVPWVRGRVVLWGNKDYPLQGVLFEIRGPGESERIRAAKTRAHGFFFMGRVPEGTYAFKATLVGFQSIIGTVIVSYETDRKNIIEIEMPPGV